jgi:glutathione S-transferase
MLDTGLDWLTERGRPEANRSQKFIDAFRRKTTASVDALEREELADGLPDIGHIAIAVALGYLDFRFDGERWRDGRPRLAAWYEGVVARKSMQATLPREG